MSEDDDYSAELHEARFRDGHRHWSERDFEEHFHQESETEEPEETETMCILTHPEKRARLRAGVSMRFAKVYLETERQFQQLRQSWTAENLTGYTRLLQRCDRLTRAGRRLA